MGAADARLALTTVATRGPAPAAAALQEHSASQMGASKVALVSAAVVLAVLQQPAASKLIAPSWDYAFPTQKQTCVNATASTPADKGTNERWVFHAVPEGTPPASGWPVWLSLVTDTFGSLDGHSECGGGGRPGFRRRTQHHGSSGKSFKAFDTPNATMTSCFKTPPGPPPPPSPWGHQSDCDYDQEAGALWNQRLKQYLIANGVAVVSVNPFTEDSWDAGPWWWDSGVDEPFLTKVFKMMKAGEFGKLDTDNVVVRGWSGGAQMVSWISQVRATNTTSEFTQSFKMKGGVMMSGGSYLCYNDPQTQPTRRARCPSAPARAAPRADRPTARTTRNAPPATQASRPTAASAARGTLQSRTSPRTQPGTKTTRRCFSGRRPRPTTTPISAPAGTTTRRWLRTGCPTRSSSW